MFQPAAQDRFGRFHTITQDVGGDTERHGRITRTTLPDFFPLDANDGLTEASLSWPVAYSIGKTVHFSFPNFYKSLFFSLNSKTG